MPPIRPVDRLDFIRPIRPIRLVRLVPFLALAALATCREPKKPVSVGDELVTNEMPAPNFPEWRLPLDSPIVSLGGSDDPDYDVDEAWAVLLSDGRVVVSDFGRWPLRVFSANGRLEKKFRNGEGPGEFKSGAVVVLPSDTMVVSDGNLYRVSVLSPSLEIVRLVRSPSQTVGPHGGVQIHAATPSGKWLRYVRDFTATGEAGTLVNWVESSADLSSERVIGQFPFGEDIVFGRRTVLGVLGSDLYLAYNERPEIEVRDTNWKVTRRFGVNLPADPVTAADQERYIEAELADYQPSGNPYEPGPSKEQYAADLRGSKFAASHPYFSDLIVADDGTVWVKRYSKTSGAAASYLVFSASGKLVATSGLPARSRLMGIMSGRALIRLTNEDGQDFYKVVAVRKPR